MRFIGLDLLRDASLVLLANCPGRSRWQGEAPVLTSLATNRPPTRARGRVTCRVPSRPSACPSRIVRCQRTDLGGAPRHAPMGSPAGSYGDLSSGTQGELSVSAEGPSSVLVRRRLRIPFSAHVDATTYRSPYLCGCARRWRGHTVRHMERHSRLLVSTDVGGDTDVEEPALRDAEEILARAAADEAAADTARARYRNAPMPALPADERIGPLLVPGERVLAVHSSALLERRQPAPGARARAGLAGTLYLTSRRVVLVGRMTLSYELGAIAEVMLAGERLLLLLHDGQGLTLEVTQPRLLRVEIAAARAAVKV